MHIIPFCSIISPFLKSSTTIKYLFPTPYTFSESPTNPCTSCPTRKATRSFSKSFPSSTLIQISLYLSTHLSNPLLSPTIFTIWPKYPLLIKYYMPTSGSSLLITSTLLSTNITRKYPKLKKKYFH